MSECNHEWSTKYTKRFYADGVEWFCIHCHETLPWPDAKRMVNEYAWMRREIERVGRALFTGTKAGYVGTEEDLHAIGQFVEGVCETAVYNEGLMSVEAENSKLKLAVQAAIEYFTDGITSKEQYDAYLRFVDAAQPFFAP